MKKLFLGALTLAVGILLSTQALAEVNFFGTAKIKPTYYGNFDFDDDTPDNPALNEGGWAASEHVRAELRLGWKATGEKWRVKMIAESDIIMNKDNADRSFYTTAEQGTNPNAGGEFGIERAEFGYSFSKALDLSAGWDIRALDIKSGGLLYGDDHPFIGLKGALGENTNYELLYIPVENQYDAGSSSSNKEWRVYSLKVGQKIVGLTVSPLIALSDNETRDASITYYGLESLGKIGPVNTSFEIIAADGEFGASNGDKDISSMALFAGVELPVSKVFNPYVAYRFTQGDDNAADNDVEGFVGITDIGRFTPLMGMDGNILGEHLASGASPYGASLYAYAPERAVGGDGYGGIGNGGSGNNPGQSLIALGSKGALSDKLSYKAQTFLIWYDDTANLTNVVNPGQAVDDYAGTTIDLQAKYAFDKNFSADWILSTFMPGDGIKDQINADDNAYVSMLTLGWKY